MPAHAFKPDWAIAPGEIIREYLAAKGWTQAELGKRMGRPAETINRIVNGRTRIEPQTAYELERVLGMTAEFWMRLDVSWQLHLYRQRCAVLRVQP